MADEIQFTFKCPQCGCATFEEILVNVTQSTAFERVNCDDDITEPDYQNTSTDGGEIGRYQCQRCGFILKDEQGQIEGLVAMPDARAHRATVGELHAGLLARKRR